MTMKTYRLEKAVVQPDGSVGPWMTNTFKGEFEIFYSEQAAYETAEERSELQEDGCLWRVEGRHDLW